MSQTTQILRPIPIVVASPPFHYVIAIRSLRISAGRQSAIGRGRVRETCANQSKPLNPLNNQTIKTVPLLRSDSPGNRKATKFVSRDSGVRVRRARQARRAERAGRRASSSLEDARRPALSRRRTPTDAPAGFVLPPQAPPASLPTVGSRVPRDRGRARPRRGVALPGFAISSTSM